MSRKVEITDEELRIYGLLAEGKAQSAVSTITGIEKSKVSRVANKLVKNRYIVVATSGKPIFYKKAENGPYLDKLILERNVAINARGVTQVAPSTVEIPTALLHHLKYKFNVITQGDLDYLMDKVQGQEVKRPFLTKYFDHRNIKRWKGQVPYCDKWVSVEYEVTPKAQTFYVYPPEMEVTADDLRSKSWEKGAEKVCMDIAGFISSRGKWQLGLPELTNWQKHIGVPTESVRGFAEHIFLQTQDKVGWLSNSNGVPETEYSDEEYAAVQLELPGEVIKLKGTVKEITQALQEMTTALLQVKEAMEATVQVNGLLVKNEAKATLDKAKDAPQDPAVAAYDGVMYQ